MVPIIYTIIISTFVVSKELYKMPKKNTYVAGQTVHQVVEYDEHGNQVITNKVIYEQREFVPGYEDVRLPKRHRFNNGDFITIFQGALRVIVEHGQLSKLEMSLLLWLIGTAGVDGSVDTNLDMICEALGAKKPNVSRALKGLVQRNIVIRKDGTRYDRQPLPIELSFNYCQLNYKLGYKGKTSMFKQNVVKHPDIELPVGEGKYVNIETGELVDDKIILDTPLFDELEEPKQKD